MHKIFVRKPIITLNDPALIVPAQTSSLYMTKREQRRQSSSYLTEPIITVKRISLLEHYSSPMDTDYDEEEEEPHSTKRRRASQHLSQLISNQQQQYENTIQIATLTKEIHYLTDKLYYAEEKVSQWKKDFKTLQAKFNQVLYENNKTNQELQDTRRMLEESEHIRSRWFMKKGEPSLCNCSTDQFAASRISHQSSFANTFPPRTSKNKKKSKKSTSSYSHNSLPKNILRLFKLNPKKSSSSSSSTL